VFVCLFVCAFAFKLLLGKYINVDVLYMVRSGIYLGRTLSIFEVRPTNRPDAIRPKPDSGGEKWSKIVVFWWFYE